jgi:hypothetical protein
MSAEVAQLAMNIARNCGYHVFPVLENKAPATPNGFLDAEGQLDAIANLWQCHPGPFIGVATGAKSGVSVLDVDSGSWAADEKPAIIEKHEAARWWWRKNASRIPPTRIYGTRSGGLHVVFQHRPGVACTQGWRSRSLPELPAAPVFYTGDHPAQPVFCIWMEKCQRN